MNTQTTTNLPQSGSKTKSLAAACLLVLTAATQADTISIGFGATLVSNPADAYFPQATNWNHWTTGAASQTSFINSLGAPVTGLELTWTQTNATQSNDTNFGPNVGVYNSTQGSPYPFNGLSDPYTCVPGDAGYSNLSGIAGNDNNYAQFKLTGIPAGSQVAALGGWIGIGLHWATETTPDTGVHSWTVWAGQQIRTQLVLETSGPLAGTQTFYFNGQSPVQVNAQSRTTLSAIQIVTPVPEPGTAVSLLGGLGMLLGLRRRRA